MTDKDLKRLSKAELLELLLAQSRENESLKAERAHLAQELDQSATMEQLIARLQDSVAQLQKLDELEVLVGRLERLRIVQTAQERASGTQKGGR